MESPRHLIEQHAKERGVSAGSAKRALYLQALANDGRTDKEAAQAFKCSVATVRMICRHFMIDMVNYRPYARLEKKGIPRPQAWRKDIALPASGLPLFGA